MNLKPYIPHLKERVLRLVLIKVGNTEKLLKILESIKKIPGFISIKRWHYKKNKKGEHKI